MFLTFFIIYVVLICLGCGHWHSKVLLSFRLARAISWAIKHMSPSIYKFKWPQAPNSRNSLDPLEIICLHEELYACQP